MRSVADLLAANPLVLLAILVAIGSAIGAVTLKRFALGPAAVLFPYVVLARARLEANGLGIRNEAGRRIVRTAQPGGQMAGGARRSRQRDAGGLSG